MKDQTPASQAVRVAGFFDTITASKSNIVIRLQDDKYIPARLKEMHHDLLRELWNSRVVISGIAKYRPSGGIRIIDVKHIGPMGIGDSLFERVPISLPTRTSPVVTLVPQDQKKGVSGFFGTWPGDESEEELLASLKEIR